MLNAQAAGPGDVEAMAAGVDEIVETDQLAHVGEVAAADDRHAAACGEAFEHGAHLVAEHGEVRARDDRRQRAVIVEEHARPLAGEARAYLVEAL